MGKDCECITLAFSSSCLKLTICKRINVRHQESECFMLKSTAKKHMSFFSGEFLATTLARLCNHWACVRSPSLWKNLIWPLVSAVSFSPTRSKACDQYVNKDQPANQKPCFVVQFYRHHRRDPARTQPHHPFHPHEWKNLKRCALLHFGQLLCGRKRPHFSEAESKLPLKSIETKQTVLELCK